MTIIYLIKDSVFRILKEFLKQREKKTNGHNTVHPLAMHKKEQDYLHNRFTNVKIHDANVSMGGE